MPNSINFIAAIVIYFLLAYLIPIRRGKQPILLWMILILAQSSSIYFFDKIYLYISNVIFFSDFTATTVKGITFGIIILANLFLILLLNTLFKVESSSLGSKKQKNNKKVKKNQKAETKPKEEIPKLEINESETIGKKHDCVIENRIEPLFATVSEPKGSENDFPVDDAFSSDQIKQDIENMQIRLNQKLSLDKNDNVDGADEKQINSKDDSSLENSERLETNNDDFKTILKSELSETSKDLDNSAKKIDDNEDLNILANTSDFSEEELSVLEPIQQMLDDNKMDEAIKYLRIVAFFGTNAKLMNHAKNVLNKLENN